MRTILFAIVFMTATFGHGQNINFKKQLKPLIESNTLTPEAKDIAAAFHRQNANPDGSMTDKAVLTNWDNMFYTRVFLGQCYYILGQKGKSISYLDSSLFYLNLAQEMNMSDCSPYIKEVKSARDKMALEEKQRAEEEAERIRQEEYNRVYGEKVITATYMGGEFLGYCLFHFQDLDGNQFTFYNSNLGSYTYGETCRLNEIYAKDTFLITYKLGKIEIYVEDIGGSQVVEKDLITSLELANPQRAKQISEQQFSECKGVKDSLMTEVKKYQSSSPSLVEMVIKQAENSTSSEQCQPMIDYLQRNLATLKAEKEELENVTQEQKKLVSSGCNPCILSVTKKFLQACVDVNGAGIKSNCSKCCYDTDADCSHIYGLQPFSYSRYMSKPDVSGAQWFIDHSEEFIVYYYSETLAGVIVKPDESSARANLIYIVKESGTWKVVGMDKENTPSIIRFVKTL